MNAWAAVCACVCVEMNVYSTRFVGKRAVDVALDDVNEDCTRTNSYFRSAHTILNQCWPILTPTKTHKYEK